MKYVPLLILIAYSSSLFGQIEFVRQTLINSSNDDSSARHTLVDLNGDNLLDIVDYQPYIGIGWYQNLGNDGFFHRQSIDNDVTMIKTFDVVELQRRGIKFNSSQH